mmetsp:Transcript_5107/g.13011  ORF Transcript_5107/g.13011 Transcript_5107/m.13011 type:complete len:207 (-) Transcript_5107:31-651(-)
MLGGFALDDVVPKGIPLRGVPAIPPLKDRHDVGLPDRDGSGIVASAAAAVSIVRIEELPQGPTADLLARGGADRRLVGGSDLSAKGLRLLLPLFLTIVLFSLLLLMMMMMMMILMGTRVGQRRFGPEGGTGCGSGKTGPRLLVARRCVAHCCETCLRRRVVEILVPVVCEIVRCRSEVPWEIARYHRVLAMVEVVVVLVGKEVHER